MSLDKCEDTYKKLGKLVFAEPVPKDNEVATWREKLDQLYKSLSQSFRVVVHGSKVITFLLSIFCQNFLSMHAFLQHSADQFERLLKEMCADEDGDLIIESAVKGTPKVFVVSSLVSVVSAQPFIFRNYQYPVGTVETPLAISESQPVGGSGSPTIGAKAGYKRNACIGSCKHQVWQSIRASSAAPYYLDDYADGLFGFARFVKKRDYVSAVLPAAAVLAAVGEPWVRVIVIALYLALAIIHHSKKPSGEKEVEATTTGRRVPIPLLCVAMAIGIRVAAKWAGYRHLTWMIV